MLWSVILVLITTCSVFFTQSGIIVTTPTPTPIVQPTQTDVVSPTPEIVIPVEPTSTPLAEPTMSVTSTVASPTAVPTNQPTATTIPPTATAIPPTASTILPTATKTVQFTPTAIPMTYAVQAGSPAFITNFAHPEAGCKWQGFAGQVFDKSGNPLMNYIVKITGSYNGRNVNLLGATGSVPGNPYGPGGYEIVLGSSIVQTYHLLSIQLYSATGTSLTTAYILNTSAFCEKNLGIINFQQK